MAFFSRTTYCIVTGASSGIGRELAIQLARNWSKNKCMSKIVLISRNLEKLQETKEMILKEAVCVETAIVQADLSNLSTLVGFSEEIFAGYEPDQYEQAAIFHNAGSLGDISHPTASQIDPFKIDEYLTLNYTSMWTLTAKFLSTVNCNSSRFVFNFSSLLSKSPMGGLAAYSSIKAAREIYIRSLALEYLDVRFLNYCPGPCDTAMFQTICNSITFDATKAKFEDIKKNVLTTEQSMNKLMKIIEDDSFENGCTIDYYDY